MSRFGNHVGIQLAPPAVDADGWFRARAVEEEVFRRISQSGGKVGAVAIRGKSQQIASAALGTLHAMTNPRRHKRCIKIIPSERLEWTFADVASKN
jgi:hypothetical protein